MRIRIIRHSVYLLFIILVSCIAARDMSTENMASDYRSSEKYFHPEFAAFNINDSVVQLYIKMLPAEFLYIRQEDGSFRSTINIHTEIISSYEMTKLIDSASASFSFDLTQKETTSIQSMFVPVKETGIFLMRCTVKDKNKGTEEDYFIPLDRISKPSREDFLVTDNLNEPLFRTYIYPGDTINIIYRDSAVNNFWCKYYNREFPLAAPPYTFDVKYEFDYQPDSLLMLSRDDMKGITISKNGFYHIQTDTIGKSGLTLFNFYNGFPEINNPKKMIEAVRYLTAKKEYDEMINSTTPKTAIDNFWLSKGGNEERTRALIKKYYGRVRDANKFFTSYTEGWRTDRGMIYIIFGSPGTIYKGAESESWIYGSPNSSLALNFFFIKVNNPFTENDYTLSRSPTYESNWYRAVEVWRQGRVYNSFY
jgi:GWxTD domain-containing protein